MFGHRISALLVLALASLMSSAVQGGATVVIQNGDPAGVGFNDPTPVSPVGGNSGTTLGQQRMIAIQAAANKWGTTLDSVPSIRALVTWEALSCDSNSAELGAAGTRTIWHDFPGVKVPGTWYPAALANALSGGDVNPDPTTAEIRARFNVNLGNSGCLTGVFFYLGLDNNHGDNTDLVTIATHELAHGLGFDTFTDGSTGAEDAGDGTPRPSIFDDFLLDTTTGLLWKDMTDAQRAASAISPRRLVWNGFNVENAVPQVLAPGTPLLTVNSPPAVAGVYSVGPADFGPALSSPGVTAPVVQAFDTSSSPSLVCNSLTGANALAVKGKIALIDRGTCNFTVKVENAQNAGAVGVLIADNVAGSPPDPLFGTDSAIFIPSVRISQADGATLKSALASGPVSATLGVNLAIRQGADANNRVLMYTPNPFQGGSSVAHIDLIAFPDQLMEPAIAGDESHEVTPPKDLTAMFMLDMGWNLSIAAAPSAPVLTSPANGSTVVGFTSLNWMASSGATSYDVYFGASPSPPLAVNTTLTSYTPPAPAPGLYYWRVVAKNANGSASSATWSFTVTGGGFCSYALSASSIALGAAGGSSSVNVTATTGCPWTAVSNVNWITVSAGSSGTGNGTVFFSAAALPSPAPRVGTLTIAGKTFTVTETAQTASLLVPITPCRIADTRLAVGPFGGPALPAQSSRVFIIPNSACNIPANASAYSLNIAVVPPGLLGYLTAYPTGQPVPLVATLNSIDGRIKSNAAIVPAGTGGAISIFVTDATDVIIDINGYFVSNNNPAVLAFYPLTPCRIADTRNPNGPFGGPGFVGQDVRTFPVLSSNCGIPATAQAYALNFAAVPNGPLGYMTAWPTGQQQPVVASLNATTGAVTANAVIVGAGTNGSVDVFAFSATDLVIDITGYFAPPGAGGLSLYNVTPCRVLDTRLPAGSPPFTGTLDVNVAASPCNVSASAKAYVFSATVVPPGLLGYLTMWPQGQQQPPTATLNAGDGAVTSNMAIIPTNNGSVSAFALSSTHLVLDIFGYFGP